nr:MAG TPA: hypothetical protein [Caudoviricetes sp.]DAW60368.1 MAG TPA: hypothetical protein [Caudoviricetes sp.]
MNGRLRKNLRVLPCFPFHRRGFPYLLEDTSSSP